MKLYILADRLKRSVEEGLKAAKKLELDIKSSEQKLTHDQVIELTKYFTEKRRFLFFHFVVELSPWIFNRIYCFI